MHDIDHIKIKYPQLLTMWQLFLFVIEGKGSNFVYTVATNLTNHSPLLQKNLCHLKASEGREKSESNKRKCIRRSKGGRDVFWSDPMYDSLTQGLTIFWMLHWICNDMVLNCYYLTTNCYIFTTYPEKVLSHIPREYDLATIVVTVSGELVNRWPDYE